jgi:hypothetical protein
MAWKQPTIEDEENKTSKINSAGLINSTLEKLWIECYTAMANGNYSLWNIKLDSIWSILGGDCKKGSDEDNSINKINLEIYNAGNLKGKMGIGFGKKENPNNALHYQLLLQKNLFLRRLQNSQGKGTAYDTGDKDDFE